MMDERSRQSNALRSSLRALNFSNPVLYIVIALLVVAALLLPPISLIARVQERGYTRVGNGAEALSHPDGLTLAVNGAADVAVKVDAIALQTLQEEKAGDGWERARQALPAHLTLRSPIYEISTRGPVEGEVQISVALPKDAEAGQTLDLYTWDSAAWRWLPSRIDRTAGVMASQLDALPSALAVVQVGARTTIAGAEASAEQPLPDGAEATLNEVYPVGLMLGADGALAGAVEDIAWTGKANVLPVVRNYGAGSDGNALTTILTNADARGRHVAALAQAAVGYTGLVLDYQGLDPSLRAAYVDFVRESANALHAQGFQLGVIAGPAALSGSDWNTGAYDWRGLGTAADVFFVPGPQDPAAYDVDGPAQALMNWAIGEVDRARIMLLVSAASVDQLGSAFVPISDDAALRYYGRLAPENTDVAPMVGTPMPVIIRGGATPLVFDEAAMTYRYSYESSGEMHTIWLSSPPALAQRLRWAGVYLLRGVALRDLFREPGAVDRVAALAAVLAPQARSAQAGAGDGPAILWTIRDPSGRVITQTTALDASRFELNADAPGAYEIGASVGAAPLGELSVAVAAQPTPTPKATNTPVGTATNTPTSTNTPPPTNTPGPSPTPRPTNTTGPTATTGPTNTPRPTNPPPPPPPGGGGGFELGGHVDGFGYPDQMRYAGMWWVKRQVRYSLGDDPNNVGWMIDQAHGAGFKILLGIVGHTWEMGAGDYFDQYAAFVGGVAARGADAIEVWNEMNIDREWPSGQISAGSYTDLLRRAYASINAGNPNTLVISGALAPTGYFGGCHGGGCDDAPYLAGMVASGALNHMDCVGIHYNEGILSPDATSGDPRGSGEHYTRYYWGMVNTYWNIVGGARRLCFTELGYLSPEGYGPLPPTFAWAGDTSVAEHAEWLGRSAQLSRNSGRVRIQIVWNVDFTYYGDDPMAGYAIIRPGGGCPACETLRAATGGR
jgi:hypothetical protein